jgi:hypothetical protein
MASRLKCKHCGRGFIAHPWSRNGQTMTCKRAMCEKKSNIYSKPMTPSQMGKKSAAAMTPAERSARAKKASNAARKKYGKDRMKQVRAGKTFAKEK